MNADFSAPAAVTKDVAVESSLARLAELAAEFGAEDIGEDARSLAERVSEGRFYVACVGQFKRGKSTLLNALISQRVLPAAVVPITTVPTVIRYGPSVHARVRLEAASWKDIPVEALEDYVSEERNPENRKQVTGVEVFVPSALLATGMCLVDTPGLGSVFSGNTATTQAFVPHIDAALVVVGADPPIAGEELALVEQVGRQVKDLLVVLNKADRTSDHDRDVARSFTCRVLEGRLRRAVDTIYEISAAERLDDRGPVRDWEKLVSALQGLVAESGRALARSAGERGLRRLSDHMLAIVTEERDALLRPIEESERRIQVMTRTLADAERSMHDLGYLFTAEQHRLSDLFLARRKAFLAEVCGKAGSEMAQSVRHLPHRYGPTFRRQALHCAQTAAEHFVLPWLEAEQVLAEEEYRKVASRFIGFGNDFLKRLSEAGIPELARMPNALDSEAGFRIRSRFTFENLIHVARPASPLRYLADLFLGVFGRYVVMEREANAFLLYLLEMNSTRVQSDIVDRVQESRSRLEVEIRKLLHEVGRVAQRALDHARTAKAAGDAAVQATLAHLEAAERELRLLLIPPAN
jgi:predicted GTPase